jgi:transcriptional regulator with XRE-family HTH domain
MTASLVAEFGQQMDTARVRVARHSRDAVGLHGKTAYCLLGEPMAALTGLPERARAQPGEDFLPATPPGVIGGAVIEAARKSARISRRKLARILAVSPGAVRRWEDGTCPLFCVPYDGLVRLAAALGRAGAKTRCEVAELALASQCDLLVTGILHGTEDYAEVPPVDEDSAEGEAARDLLRWALAGILPGRSSPFATARPLLAAHDLITFTAVARQLGAGSHGGQLAGYGRSLGALTAGRIRS